MAPNFEGWIFVNESDAPAPSAPAVAAVRLWQRRASDAAQEHRKIDAVFADIATEGSPRPRGVREYAADASNSLVEEFEADELTCELGTI